MTGHCNVIDWTSKHVQSFTCWLVQTRPSTLLLSGCWNDDQRTQISIQRSFNWATNLTRPHSSCSGSFRKGFALIVWDQFIQGSCSHLDLYQKPIKIACINYLYSIYCACQFNSFMIVQKAAVFLLSFQELKTFFLKCDVNLIQWASTLNQRCQSIKVEFHSK